MSLKAELDNLHKHYDATKSLGYAADRLADLAKSARNIGLRDLADQLSELSIGIRRDARDARNAFAFTVEINSRHQDTLQATANMIGACMAIDQARQGDKQ